MMCLLNLGMCFLSLQTDQQVPDVMHVLNCLQNCKLDCMKYVL